MFSACGVQSETAYNNVCGQHGGPAVFKENNVSKGSLVLPKGTNVTNRFVKGIEKRITDDMKNCSTHDTENSLTKCNTQAKQKMQWFWIQRAMKAE